MIEFTLEYGLWGGHYRRLPGASWRAMFVDRVTGQRYAGSDDDPWCAIAWALDERELRRSGRHMMARNEGDRPGAALEVEPPVLLHAAPIEVEVDDQAELALGAR